MGWKCVVEGSEIEDVKKDRKNSVMIEGYDFSEKAVYFKGCYLPFSQVKSVRSQPSAIRIRGGGCGIGLPVFKIRLEYGAERPVVLVVEDKDNADEIIRRICAGNRDTTIEYYVDPHTGLRPEKLSLPLY
ncbi:MAG: hypothetical protein J6P76_05885 [Acidaminococcaceae bacterium]|nr:hypothetical protein [Acidaminococcaceae bacterium]MBO6039374.1 hypothetical protein [Acidaminococcaceae bacterium]MBP5736374.1 hypothetical protein [Acidaminococcaceae bacterium]